LASVHTPITPTFSGAPPCAARIRFSCSTRSVPSKSFNVIESTVLAFAAAAAR
jgi:hypothetical protein